MSRFYWSRVVFPAALCRCEAWTMGGTDAEAMASFELKCSGQILGVSWMEKVASGEMLSGLDMGTAVLLRRAKTLDLKCFGHIGRCETLGRHILEAGMDGGGGRAGPAGRWEQDVSNWMDVATARAGGLAEDRMRFRQRVQEATSRQEIGWSGRGGNLTDINFTCLWTFLINLKGANNCVFFYLQFMVKLWN